MRGLVKIIILAVIIAATQISSAFFTAEAQVIQPQQVKIPANVDPGVINQVQSQRSLSENTGKKIPDTKLDNLNPAETKESEKPAILINSKFQLDKIIFTGNTVFRTSDLEKFASNIIGKEVSLEDVKAVTSQITKLYRDNGYLTSLAYVPPQKISDGTIEITILEGKVGNINIQGNRWTRLSYVKNNVFKANDFKQNEVFNVNSLRKSLKELHKNDYLKGQVTLQKGVEPETTDIILNIKERFPLDLGVSWDNLGRDLVGIQRANVTLADNNLTGFGDSLFAGVSFATRTFGLNTGYSVPIGPYGTEFRFGYGLSDVNLGGAYKQYKIEGSSHLFSTALTQPLYKSDTLSLISDMAFDMRHSRTTIQKSSSLQNYELRVLRLGVNGIKDDKSGRWISRAEVSTGLPFLGGTSDSSWGVGSSKFVKFNGNLIRVHSLPFRTTAIFRLSGQYSPNAILAPEQMQIGGMYSVRGYDEGLVLGDVGYTASIEFRKPIPYLPDKKWLPLKDRVQFAAFYDQGWAHQIHQGVNENYTNFLQGLGVGLRCQLSKYIMANIDLGIPLGKKRSPNQDAVKFHFGLSTDLF